MTKYNLLGLAWVVAGTWGVFSDKPLGIVGVATGVILIGIGEVLGAIARK